MSPTDHTARIFQERSCLTPEELAGYAAGTLTDRERHHIERHLLDCELCAEALDGVMSMEDPAALHSITPEPVRRRGLPFWRRPAAAVAAVVSIFLLSAVYLAFFREAGQHEALVTHTVKEEPPEAVREAVPGAAREKPAIRVTESPAGMKAPVESRVPVAADEVYDAAEPLRADDSQPVYRPDEGYTARAATAGTARSVHGKPVVTESLEETVSEDDFFRGVEAEEAGSDKESRHVGGLLTAYYQVPLPRQKGAVYMEEYKISPQYVLTDIDASPMNSYVSVKAIAKDKREQREKKSKSISRTESEAQKAAPAKERSYAARLQEIFVLLDSTLYVEAMQRLESFNKSFPGDGNGIYYRGYTAFMLELDEAAARDFEWTLNRTGSIFADDATWYGALLKARKGRVEEARATLRPLTTREGPYREHARSLMELLDDN